MSKKLKNVDVRDALATAEAELDAILKRAETLRQWIALTRKIGTANSKHSGLVGDEFVRFRRTKTVGVIKNILAVLEEVGKPMHVDQILEKLGERGQLPGAKNPKATIAVALSRRPDKFRRTAPNTFGLVSTPQEIVVNVAS